MPSIVIRLVLGIVALVVLALAIAWIAGFGPFHSPSAAAKLQPQVAATVAKTTTAETKAVTKAETKTQAAGVAAEKRTETNVAKLRAAPPGVGDAEFYRSVCQSKFYSGSADCRRYGGKP